MGEVFMDNEEIVFLDEDEKEEEEILSLCDFPKNEENQTNKESPRGNITREDFDFCSCSGTSLLENSEMCNADEVFFQGQILPLSYSNNLPSDSHDTRRSRGRATCNERSTVESPSFEHYVLQLRRESNVNTTIASTTTSSSYKPRIRNQFHSDHQNPTPHVRFSNVKHRNSINSFSRKSTMWSLFRVGLVTISPEIALQDLKIRCNKDFKSQYSTSSSSSGGTNNENKKQRFLEKNMAFLGSCKCSVNAVETVDSKVATMNKDHDFVNSSNKDAHAMKETKKHHGLARRKIMTKRI